MRNAPFGSSGSVVSTAAARPTAVVMPRLARADDRTVDADRRAEYLLDLLVESPVARTYPQPVTVGIPFRRGLERRDETLILRHPDGRETPVQTDVLAVWPDGSAKWMLLDFVLQGVERGTSRFSLVRALDRSSRLPGDSIIISEAGDRFLLQTGASHVSLERSGLLELGGFHAGARESGLRARGQWVLTTARGKRHAPRVQRTITESRGAIRTTIRQEGSLGRSAACRFVTRISVFHGTGLVRLEATLHNTRRARHRGGLWDLGDPGSFLFRDLSLEITLGSGHAHAVQGVLEVDNPSTEIQGSRVAIHQYSSGGPNWRSRNHVGRDNRVTLGCNGYDARIEDVIRSGLRATPIVVLPALTGGIAATLPEFWQQFPKAIEAGEGSCVIRLFPEQPGSLHELQGGEQKTHTIWLAVRDEALPQVAELAWVHEPARVRAHPGWYARTGVLPDMVPDEEERHAELLTLRDEALDPSRGLEARREVIDEFGWRHFGEVFADHEGEHYSGPLPVISHYNNQYDQVLGFLAQYLATGDCRWYALFEPLARHVAEIDVYHTREDRPAYNGGHFWFTDHYLSAETATHRTYSRRNRSSSRAGYGGGPSSNHLFTRGLCQAYYVTGNPLFRQVVIELADWVVAMDDGRRTILGLVDDGPTGLASFTGELAYQGPGRGAGNSITALMDAWELTGTRDYMEKAEAIIRRVVHPDDDIEAFDLLNAEKRWSYTVFLSALADYLKRKAAGGELDAMYAYGQATLRAYARWMLVNERPSLDRRHELEYPTEAWPGQDLRKANVLRMASAHEDEPARSRMLCRADELADRAWADLMAFPSRSSARALALVLVEGVVDRCLASHGVQPAPRAEGCSAFPRSEPFTPQRIRVLRKLRSPGCWPGVVRGLLSPWKWLRLLEQRRASCGVGSGMTPPC